MQIAVFGAVVVGSVAGGLAALHSSSEPPGASPPAPPSAAPALSQLPAPRPTAQLPDPRVLLEMQVRAVLTRFAAWSRDHAGAPCPDSATLGVIALDPWGHPIELTCTDQPADQMIGATSAGPDGIAGNGDDVASWALGRDITDLVRGARWTSTPAPAVTHGKEPSSSHDRGPAMAPAAPAIPPASPTSPASATHTKPKLRPSDAGTDDIPSRR